MFHVKRCLFAETKSAEQSAEHVLHPGASSQPIEGRAGEAQILRDQHKIESGGGVRQSTCHFRNMIGLTAVERDRALVGKQPLRLIGNAFEQRPNTLTGFRRDRQGSIDRLRIEIGFRLRLDQAEMMRSITRLAEPDQDICSFDQCLGPFNADRLEQVLPITTAPRLPPQMLF